MVAWYWIVIAAMAGVVLGAGLGMLVSGSFELQDDRDEAQDVDAAFEINDFVVLNTDQKTNPSLYIVTSISDNYITGIDWDGCACQLDIEQCRYATPDEISSVARIARHLFHEGD